MSIYNKNGENKGLVALGKEAAKHTSWKIAMPKTKKNMNYTDKIENPDQFTKKEETYLKSLGFKKKWFSDRSGHWFSKDYKINKKSTINITVEYSGYGKLQLGFDHCALDPDGYGSPKKLKNITQIKAIDSKINKIVKLYKSI